MFGKDYVPAGQPRRRALPRSTGQVVFVGQGIVAPRYKRDDYRGADVRGRIVAFFGGATMFGDPEERAHFARNETKAALAAERGAIGYLEVEPLRFRRHRAAVRSPAGDLGRARTAGFTGRGAAPLGTLSAAGARQAVRAPAGRRVDAAVARRAATLAVATRDRVRRTLAVVAMSSGCCPAAIRN